ncbi:hypothetical protein Leryth_011791 [Lithospermum erythrorhizon]|nr:hypothetical protein Leryth_011791 [Lithospermum erythrorhizon]
MDSGGSILETTGSELITVMTPVSICMLTVVLLITTLQTPTPQIRTAANLVYLESPSDTNLVKLEGSFLNALVFVLIISLITFLLYILYYYNFTNFLKHYTRFSAFFVLSSLGGSIWISLITHFLLPVDVLSFGVVLFNFTVVGVVSVFGKGCPIVVKQFYSVVLGVIVAAWFTQLPEWTTWVLLVALALYDLVAVLAPGGPLRVMVELASSREEEIPALVYEARPNVRSGSGVGNSRVGNLGILVAGITQIEGGSERNRGREDRSRVIELQNVVRGRNDNEGEGHVINVDRNEIELTIDESGDQGEALPLMAGNERPADSFRVDGSNSSSRGERGEVGVSLMQLMNDNERNRRRSNDDDSNGDDDDDDNGLMPGIKLGLGDFIFYSVLVGRAAMYDLMTVYACYLAIISGLGCTLILLAVFRRALPALPISIALGVIFYFLTRLLMEPFVVGTATNLMMF